MSLISVTPLAPTLLVSANFTVEPLEPSLLYWLKELHFSHKVKFAPYNQIYQQLLDPNSSLVNNQQGLNVLLVCLEDWIGAGRLSSEHCPLQTDQALTTSPEGNTQSSIPSHLASYQLPNGMTIAHQNSYETAYLFKEIFEDQAYLKHGVTIKEGDCIVDIGANIGIFTLFAQQLSSTGKIYAIEPSPPVFETLQANAQLYGNNVKVFNCGISNENKSAIFTYYPHSSVFSSFAADKEADETVLRAIIQNQQEQAGAGTSEQHVATFVENGRMDSVQYTCQLRSLSDIIREEQIERIDLLKLDAEKSELAVLQGISADDWPKIRQIVMEAHENSKRTVLTQITEILAQQGFEVHVDQESLLNQTTFFNIYAWRPNESELDTATAHELTKLHTQLQHNADELVDALGSFGQHAATPLILCLCPAAPTTMTQPGVRAFISEVELNIGRRLANMKNISLLTLAELEHQYGLSTYFDPFAYKTGHIPYTSAMFAALGSAVMRKFHALQARPYKVVVLDCDNTLWHGVCAEEGAQGVSISPPYRQLQEFMVKQMASGMLLCLCSKNQEEDVLSLFDHRSDMPLKKEHLVSWRINWAPKSENIKSLAQELQLGLDSFIFIDDNPLECAEVRAHCPEVLTLQLPPDIEEIGHFLEHVWAFDRAQVTQEDRSRTLQYQQNVQREQLRKTALTLQEFLDSLGLQVTISPLTPNQTARVSQLTQRTNQFNLTNVRYSEAAIEEIRRSTTHTCLTVQVSDRFGDYGLVGATIFSQSKDAIVVDSFLLSCRALGRHVEHRMLVKLAEIAGASGATAVVLPYTETSRNQPALEFLEQVGSNFKRTTDSGAIYTIPDSVAATAAERATASASSPMTPVQNDGAAAEAQTPQHRDSANFELYQKIASELNRAEKVARAVALQTRPRPTLTQSYAPAQTVLEREVANIWQDVLHLEQVGVNDNFTELGGSSLQVIQIHSRLTNDLHVEMPITQLFGLPTIRALVHYLNRNDEANASATAVQERAAKQRMAINRNKLARNRVR